MDLNYVVKFRLINAVLRAAARGIKIVAGTAPFHENRIAPDTEPVAPDFFTVPNHSKPTGLMQTDAGRVVLHDIRLQHPIAVLFGAANHLA